MVDNIVLNLAPLTLPTAARALIEDSHALHKEIHWFDFVPSNYEVVYTILASLRRGRFCDWGAGLGVVTGLAEMLGYEAMGVEFHEPLVVASRKLLDAHGLESRIECGDLYERRDVADLYFVYCWPGKVIQIEERFREIASDGARLLLYYGPNDTRWMQKT